MASFEEPLFVVFDWNFLMKYRWIKSMWLIEIMITVSDFFILIFKVDRNLMWLYMRIEIQ